MKSLKIIAATLISLFTLLTPLHASEGHSGQSHSDMATPADNKMFLEKRDINGYSVSFHVMEAGADMNHGGTHNVMIKVEKGGKAVSDIKANTKVVYPNGTDESKLLMKMGDWYTAGYDLNSDGKHQIMVLFKTADGQKNFGGVYYQN